MHEGKSNEEGRGKRFAAYEFKDSESPVVAAMRWEETDDERDIESVEVMLYADRAVLEGALDTLPSNEATILRASTASLKYGLQTTRWVRVRGRDASTMMAFLNLYASTEVKVVVRGPWVTSFTSPKNPKDGCFISWIDPAQKFHFAIARSKAHCKEIIKKWDWLSPEEKAHYQYVSSQVNMPEASPHKAVRIDGPLAEICAKACTVWKSSGIERFTPNNS